MRDKKTIVITGPTASGKSALAISLAKILDTEIISADSRQIYQGIPVATAVPSMEERAGVAHHLMECLPLDSYYSASRFVEDAESLSGKILRTRQHVIICGGSMMYVDAFCYGIDELPTVPQELRNSLMKEWQEKGDEWLINRLKDLDPAYYQKVDLNNLKRVFHAVEISLTASRPYSSLLSGNVRAREDVIKICLDGNRDFLFSAINKRVEKMVQSGLVEEAKRVYDMRHLNSLNTVGIKEMFAYIEGKFTLEEGVARIQKNTRVYAKKQITWHKRDKNAVRLDFASPHHVNVDKILNILSCKD